MKAYAPVTVRIGSERPIAALKKLGTGVPLPTPKPGLQTRLEAKPRGGIQQRALSVPIGKGASLQPLNSLGQRDLFGTPGGLYANVPVSGKTQ